MARFRDVIRGTEARTVVRLPCPGTKARPDGSFDGATVEVALRALIPSELAGAREAASRYAERAAAKAEEGDPVYEMALRAYVLLVATLDAEKPEERAPFFESIDEVMKTDGFTDAHIAYLFELWEQWQDNVSPRMASLDADTVNAITMGAAEGNMLPFFSLRPGTRWLFVRSLARLHLDSLRRSSASSSDSPT